MPIIVSQTRSVYPAYHKGQLCLSGTVCKCLKDYDSKPPYTYLTIQCGVRHHAKSYGNPVTLEVHM